MVSWDAERNTVNCDRLFIRFSLCRIFVKNPCFHWKHEMVFTWPMLFFNQFLLCSYRGNVLSWQWLWLLQYCGSHCISESLFHFFWIWNKWCPIDTAKARHWTVACNWHMWERNKNLFLLAHWGGAYFGVCRFRTQETRCWWTDIAHGLCCEHSMKWFHCQIVGRCQRFPRFHGGKLQELKMYT